MGNGRNAPRIKSGAARGLTRNQAKVYRAAGGRSLSGMNQRQRNRALASAAKKAGVRNPFAGSNFLG
jgi:hypothetical protein